MEILFWILAATFFNSIIALVGGVSLWLNPKTLNKLIVFLVAFAAGSLLGGAFLHLLAESIEKPELGGFDNVALLLIAGFSLFFIMERVFKWHHCHNTEKCDTHPFTYLILIGDGLHNFIDGLVISASFLVSIPFGLVTTLIIIGHELPQEIGDFGVLVYGGLSRKKALAYNFASQLTSILGGVLGFFIHQSNISTAFLLPVAAGGFIYIATSDLIPELHKEPNTKKSILSFIVFFLGILFMLGIKFFAGG